MHPIDPFLDLAGTHSLAFEQPGGVFRVPLAGAYAFHSAMKLVGVTTGFCLLRAALAGLAPVERAAVRIESGHPGSGMEDTFEYFTRCVSTGRYQRRDFVDGLRIPGAEGVFRWRISLPGVVRDLSLRADVVPAVLFTAVAPEAMADRLAYQHHVAQRMLAAEPSTLFETVAEGTA
jgi:hypothetical protein